MYEIIEETKRDSNVRFGEVRVVFAKDDNKRAADNSIQYLYKGIYKLRDNIINNSDGTKTYTYQRIAREYR